MPGDDITPVNWGGPVVNPGRHELGVPALVVPQGTRCGVRKVGAGSWAQHVTAKQIAFRSARNSRAGQKRFIFRWEGWEMIVDKQAIQRIRVSEIEVVD